MNREDFLQSTEINDKFLKQIIENREFNDVIVSYYDRLYQESRDDGMKKKQENVKGCNDFWIIDKYHEHRLKEFKRTNLCKDKFCNNCKKVKQASRMGKFIPLIRPFAENMYQLTLTLPNVKGDELKETICKMQKAFARLIEYFKGKKQINGIDFEVMQYEGAIRSLEITYKGNEYHPHYHALIVLKVNKLHDSMIRKHKNVYSVDFKGKREPRLFSDIEILIQKVWYLILNGKRVTESAIQSLKKGYSCQLDKFNENDFVEIFKYMTKATTEDGKTLSYKQFKTLYYALFKVRQIQGYGIFYNLKDDEEINFDEVNEAYAEFIEELQTKEKPVTVSEAPEQVRKESGYTVFSRKTFQKYWKQVMSE
ncbi:protein rep [Bacillus cereus group sp. MYBK81-2]|uniref:protein rep n=1 Tax=Bacillus cereus group sp. MYBK81-2 TaxID=3450604 RepID=UPI003F7AABE1